MAQSKFLTLAGLSTYDTKLKEWLKESLKSLDNLYFKLSGGDISSTVTIVRPDSSVDTMYYANRTDMDAKIGFGIGTSGNRGIYDAKAGGWLLKIDTNNAVTFSGTAANAGNADTLDNKHATDFASADHPHGAGDITSGKLNIARIPTGTTSTTVSLGNHTHSASSLTRGYLNTHPENGPTIIPFVYNDLAFLTKKGGSCKIYKTTSTDFTAASLAESSISISAPDNIFDGTPSYTMISTTGEYTVVIDMVLNKTYSWSNVFYIDFGATSWIAKNIYVYAMNSTKESKYVLKNSTTSNTSGNWYTDLSHSVTINNATTQGFDRLRVVLSGFKNTTSTSGKRISQIGIINYGSAGVSETYISRGGCEGIYGSLIPNTNNSIDLGSSSKKIKSVYATTLYGNLGWSYITDKPTEFPPSEHSHPYLPTSGGTLTGPLSISTESWNNQLKLTRTSNGSNWGPVVSFYDERGGRGALFMESNNLFIADVAGTTSLKRQVSVVGHTHTKAEITDFAHTHDDRYYTETEADGRFAPKSHSHNYIVNGASSIELNNNSSLADYGGFIDFHFHKKDANDGNKIKPTDTSGNIVTTIPDYTSRIIEDSPGRISVNGTKFTHDSNGKTNVTADYFKGTADKAVDSDTLDGKHADYFAEATHTHSDRLFVTLVPTGTAIPANADLKTTQYLKVGRYYCSATATAVTLKNCPVSEAFMMEVYSPLSTTLDNETSAKWVYRLRKITHYSTGIQYIQYIGSGSTPGAFTYGVWYAIPQVSVTMDSTDTNGSSCVKGSATKPVYINSSGQFVECNSYPTSLPANGGNADTVDNKHATDFASAVHPHAAGDITSGTFGTDRIPNLAASKITSGTFDTARIPNLAASKITSGIFDIARIPTGETASTVALGNHSHSELTIESISDPNLAFSDQKLKYYLIGSTNSGTEGYAGKNYGFPVSHNANSILWLGNHSGNYGGQLGISGNGYLYYRWITSGTFPTTANGASWNRIAYASDIPTSLPASDVYAWAKAANKPSYNFGEIGAGNATIGDGTNRLILRTSESWASSIYHHTTADEAVVFLNKGKNVNGTAGYTTSWIFAYGNPTERPSWTDLTPAMQIKDDSVVINKLLGTKVKASYNLDVNGSANATTLYENGIRVATIAHTHDITITDDLKGTLESILESLNAAIQTNSGLIAANATAITGKSDKHDHPFYKTSDSRTKNTVLAGPSTGSDGAATFRKLTVSDLPTGETASTVALGNHGHSIFTAAKNKNLVFAGPSTGNAAVPSFRSLVSDDIPNLSASKITTGTFDTGRIPNLSASKITSDKLDIARIPTGETATTVALGNHTHSGYMAAGDTSHGTHVTDNDQEWAGVKTFVNGIRIGDDSDPDEELEDNRTIYFGDSSYAYITEFPSDELTLSAGRINMCGEDTLTTKAIFPETTNYTQIVLPTAYTASTKYSLMSFSRTCTKSTFATVGESSYNLYINGSTSYLGIGVSAGYTLEINVGASYTAYRDTLLIDTGNECHSCRNLIEYTVQPFLDSSISTGVSHRIRYYLTESSSSTTPISGTETDIPITVDGYTSLNPLTITGSTSYVSNSRTIKYTNTSSSYKTVYLRGKVLRPASSSVSISSATSGYWRYTAYSGSDIDATDFKTYPTCRYCGTQFNETTRNTMWNNIGNGKTFYTYFKDITTYYKSVSYKTNTTFSLPSLPMSEYGPVAVLGNGIISGTSTTFDNTNLVSGDKGLINTTTQLCYKFADALSGFLVDSNKLSYISGASTNVSICPSRIFDITVDNGLTFAQGSSSVSPQYIFNVKNGKITLGYSVSSSTVYNVEFDYNGIRTPNRSGSFTLGSSSNRFGTIYSTSTINTSDERFKELQSNIEIDFDKLKTIPKFIFKWKDSFLKDDDDLHIGTSAQAIRDIYPEIVHVYNNDVALCAPRDIYDPDAVLAIEYDKLGVIALAAIDKLHEENVQLKEENEQLKTRLDNLEAILKEKGIL